MVGNKLAAGEVLQRVLATLKDERGVQVENVATALGALSGRACHLAARDGRASRRPEYAGRDDLQVGTSDGRTFVMGPAISWPLLESPHSVWSLVAGYAQSQGAPLPDVHELVRHSAATVGGPEFGRPRYAPRTAPTALPIDHLGAWEPMLAHIVPLAPDPQQWPVVYGLAVQGLFQMTGGQFDLTVLTRVVMDSALATSKIPVAS
ncbi:hypothetical protein [Cellulomonas wangsupingiae]|uniref:Uncharacterized protein n=1 Tax=Cellulomonas wangsupingiae TaxID=2968085 RepID=A0ABY5K9I1_9CELL|nr:hypothetical protein [Cellulomonas wangsupingiae]MCC2333816.1 hypothetical protein [Cellulomonas wangsupingiae]UUI65078.1 hypothetical protein NP075_18515 [Cellulomonas wangsupingiae]